MGSLLGREALVTTGRPELPTVVGSFQVMEKSSPWTMRSPWPYGSPYWYAPSTVQYQSTIWSRRLVCNTRCDSFFGDAIGASLALRADPNE